MCAVCGQKGEELNKSEYYLIKSDVLPEVFGKVMEVKRLLSLKKASSVNEAVKIAGMSRSAY